MTLRFAKFAIAGLLAIALPLLLSDPADAATRITDIACENTTTSGIGQLDLGGAAVGGFLPFLTAGVSNGDTVPYSISNGVGVGRTIETGVGVFTDADPDTLTRVAAYSTDGAGVELTLSGISTVCISPIASTYVNGGSATSWSPTGTDTATLGTTALQWSDTYLAEGGAINWDNGDCILTQTGDSLALSSCVLVGANESFVIAASDETTVITAAADKATFRAPYAFTVTSVKCGLNVGQTAGSLFTVDINEDNTSIISTKLTFDNNETTTTTAATPAVISDASIAADAEVEIDVDTVGTGSPAGLKCTLIGHQ